MHRASLILTGALACVVLVFGASAGAKTAPKTCTTSSENVVGKKVTGTLTSSNVEPSQARYATCAQAKKAMDKITALRIEEPKSVAAFYCVPIVKSTAPDVVSYTCTFKGADTAAFIKLIFRVKYNQD